MPWHLSGCGKCLVERRPGGFGNRNLETAIDLSSPSMSSVMSSSASHAKSGAWTGRWSVGVGDLCSRNESASVAEVAKHMTTPKFGRHQQWLGPFVKAFQNNNLNGTVQWPMEHAALTERMYTTRTVRRRDRKQPEEQGC